PSFLSLIITKCKYFNFTLVLKADKILSDKEFINFSYIRRLTLYKRNIVFSCKFYTLHYRNRGGSKMSTVWVITIALVALIAGVALGFFIARKYMMSYLKKNQPINEQMLRTMMMQMEQKPSQKKINQMMRSMNNQYDQK